MPKRVMLPSTSQQNLGFFRVNQRDEGQYKAFQANSSCLCRTPNLCLLTLAVCLARRNAKSGFRKDTQLSPGRLSRQSMLAWPSRFVTETKFHDKNASVTNADETKHGKLGAHGKSAEKNSRNRMRRGMIVNTRT